MHHAAFAAQLVFDVAIIFVALYFGVKLMALQDIIESLQADVDDLSAEVIIAVEDIAALKAQLSGVASPEQLAALQAVADKLTAATSALKAGE